MKHRKLLSAVLAALLALDVICFGVACVIHATSDHAGSASVSLEIIDEPTGEYTTEEIIIEHAYQMDKVEEDDQFKIYASYTRFDNGTKVDDPMTLTNMFPGDHISKTYRITSEYQHPLDLVFTVDIRDDAESVKLSEVMMINIKVNGKQVYDGLMKDIKHTTALHCTPYVHHTAILEYEIDVYLPTSAGNEYMNKTLKCDYLWTMYEYLPTPQPPKPEEPEVEVEIPVEGITDIEEFIYIPEPCRLSTALWITGTAFILLLLALVLVSRKGDADEKQ